MNVPEEVKAKYTSRDYHKKLILRFPGLGLEINNNQIWQESMKLKESLVKGKNIEFVGCIASSFSVKVHNVFDDLKDEYMEVYIQADETPEIPLFHGYVDSAVSQTNKNAKKITAFDALYTRGNMDVAAWYNSLNFPITLKNLRDSFFNCIGIQQKQTELPNDDITVTKQFEPNTLQAIVVMKSICQINGAFGIINRDGDFEYRILKESGKRGVYPSVTLFPSNFLFPSDGTGGGSGNNGDSRPKLFAFYRKVDYDEFSVKPVDRLTIRNSEEDAGVSYGDGLNNYIIQGNMFALGQNAQVLRQMAENIYPNVKWLSYVPFNAKNNGLPFLECGEAVEYYTVDFNNGASTFSARAGSGKSKKSFYVLNREMNGIQSLKDNYSAKGEEYQSEFVTDLKAQVQSVKNQTNQYDSRINSLEQKIVNIQRIVSVPSLPSNPDPNTIYLIQGEVVVN